MQKKLNGLSLVFVGTLSLLAGVYSPLSEAEELYGLRPDSWRPGRYSFSLNADYFSTTSNFEPSGGVINDLGEGRKYENLHTHFSSRVVMKRQWALIGSLGMASATSQNVDEDRSNLGFTDLLLGTQYSLRWKRFRFSPEALLTYPLAKVEENTDKALLSEGATKIRLGSWLQLHWLGLKHHLFVAGEYRDGGRSSLLHWNLGTSKHWRTIQLGAEASGLSSLTDDKYVANPTARENVPLRVNAQSLRYNSVNPELLVATGWVGFGATPGLHFRLGYKTTLNGTNTAAGQSVLATLTWNINATPPMESFSDREQKNEASKLNSFEPESTDYDPTLFEEEPKPRSRPKKKRRKKRRR